MPEWQRKRIPEDVPTPLAVALSDFCRRARAPASAQEVREALALVGEDEDFRVRALTDAEPEASPLGPFAVIDVVRGAPPSLAAQRQSCGYYQIARELAVERERTTAPPAPPAAPLFVAPPQTTDRPARSARAKSAAAPSISDRIAPKRRAPAPLEGEAVEDLDDVPGPFTRRELPKPRGRFTRLPTSKRPANELFKPEAGPELAALVEQHGHRIALHRSLADQYAGRAGSLFGEADLEAALAHHGLIEEVESRERELLLSSFREHRGAKGKVSWALGLSPPELDRLIDSAGLEQEVEEVRERFRREALSPRNLSLRLDLLGRTRYLVDLGIKRRFTESLTAELREILRESWGTAPDLNGLLQHAARRQGVAAELLTRAVEKLELGPELRQHTRASH